MSSANTFNLDKTKLLSSGKGLKDNILVVSNSDLSSANTFKPNQPKVVTYHAIELKKKKKIKGLIVLSVAWRVMG